MSTRILILDRIEVLRKYEQGFDRRTIKWGNLFLVERELAKFATRKQRSQGVHISEVSFSELDDALLLDVFEVVLRWHYTQM